MSRSTHLIVMAAIVASLLFFPAAVVLAVVCAVAGFPAESIATFGDRLGLFSGLLAWWLIVLAFALPYTALVFPWHAKLDGFERPAPPPHERP